MYSKQYECTKTKETYVKNNPSYWNLHARGCTLFLIVFVVLDQLTSLEKMVSTKCDIYKHSQLKKKETK